MGSHSLLQGTFSAQGWNLDRPHFRQILYHLSPQGSPVLKVQLINNVMTVSSERQRDLAMFIYVFILPETPLHPGCHITWIFVSLGLLKGIAYSTLPEGAWGPHPFWERPTGGALSWGAFGWLLRNFIGLCAQFFFSSAPTDNKWDIASWVGVLMMDPSRMRCGKPKYYLRSDLGAVVVIRPIILFIILFHSPFKVLSYNHDFARASGLLFNFLPF